jgi:hypothetical protein
MGNSEWSMLADCYSFRHSPLTIHQSPFIFLNFAILKKVVSISLMAILLFNWAGFRMLSFYLEQQADTQLESQLDKDNYDESMLISVKVPAGHLPGYTLSRQFERVDGDISVNGTRYKYVKRRVFNDSVELLCIPDQQGTQLLNARDDFFKLVNDLQQTGENKKGSTHPGQSKNASTDNYIVHDLFHINNPALIFSKRLYHYTEGVVSIYAPVIKQPPEVVGLV